MSEDWIRGMTADIMRRVVARREELGITTAFLAEMCTDAGMPFTKDALATVEKGQRRSITVQELLVFAHVLETSPLALLWPQAGEVEIVPEVTGDAQYARRWTGMSEWDAERTRAALEAKRAAEALLSALGRMP